MGNGQRAVAMIRARSGSHENNCVIGAQVGREEGTGACVQVCAACCTCQWTIKITKMAVDVAPVGPVCRLLRLLAPTPAPAPAPLPLLVRVRALL